jgi:hypothetical protein
MGTFTADQAAQRNPERLVSVTVLARTFSIAVVHATV